MLPLCLKRARVFLSFLIFQHFLFKMKKLERERQKEGKREREAESTKLTRKLRNSIKKEVFFYFYCPSASVTVSVVVLTQRTHTHTDTCHLLGIPFFRTCLPAWPGSSSIQLIIIFTQRSGECIKNANGNTLPLWWQSERESERDRARCQCCHVAVLLIY